MNNVTSNNILRFLAVAAAVSLACDAQDEGSSLSGASQADDMEMGEPEISDADGGVLEPSAPSELPEALSDFSDDSDPYTDAVIYSYILTPNKVSPKIKWRGCTFRVWYGNYISVPFAKLQMYGGDCAGWRTWVWSLNGNTLKFTKDSGKYSGGEYGGEPYFGLQATGPAPAYGIGQRVCDESGYCLEFWYK